MPLNTNPIEINSLEDLGTLGYFATLVSDLERDESFKTFTLMSEERKVYARKAKEFLPDIVAVRNGYVVLKDGTIRCSPFCSFYVASYDECLESEMIGDYSQMIRLGWLLCQSFAFLL